MGVEVEIEIVRGATDEVLKAFDRLLPQLSVSGLNRRIG
jgi:hypothetical protein